MGLVEDIQTEMKTANSNFDALVAGLNQIIVFVDQLAAQNTGMTQAQTEETRAGLVAFNARFAGADAQVRDALDATVPAPEQPPVEPFNRG